MTMASVIIIKIQHVNMLQEGSASGGDDQIFRCRVVEWDTLNCTLWLNVL
jgi:hypothetical protein